MSFLKALFSSPPPFNFEQQLANDTQHMYTWPVDAVNNPDEHQVDEKHLTDGSLPRRVKGISKPIEVYNESENNGKGWTTLYELFHRGLAKSPNGNCLGTRSYTVDKNGKPSRGSFVWQSYSAVDQVSKNIGIGLIQLGLSAGTNVGIYSINRAEWMMTALACYSQSLVVVALYATLGEAAIEYIFDHSELSFIFASADNMDHVLSVAPKTGKVKIIVQYDVDELLQNTVDAISEKHQQRAKELGIRLLGFSELEKLGAAAAATVFPNLPQPDTLAMIMYTSGTTGPPKGAMLTHGNITAVIATVPYIADLNREDRHLSYLPLAHIMESLIQLALLANGASIGFYQGNIKKFADDLNELQPTFLAGVPRIFNRIYQQVWNTINQRNFIVRFIINRAYDSQANAVRFGLKRNERHDRKIFSKIAEKVGIHKVRFVLTGAAPCPPFLLEFLQVITNARCLQGYGMTESCGAIACTLPGDLNKGHVGAPIPAVTIKLVSLPELGYTLTDRDANGNLTPRGEIYAKGANVFQGYYKDEENTRETLIDGWLKTGDVARLNANGSYSIIDRAKNIFKLSQGEYIAVERIESVYSKSPAVGQLFIYGNSFKSFLVAVIVPNADFTCQQAKAHGFWTGGDSKLGDQSFQSAYKDALTGAHVAELKSAIAASLKEQEKFLKGFERIVDFHIESEINALGLGFTEENECITPTFKLKRNFLLKRYINQIKELYSANGEPVGKDEKWPGEK